MSVGLLAVVDDILTAAVKASAKATGVVIDDAAVTPQYVHGLEPARELPVVGKIALGSILNKLVVIIPVALLLTQFAPWLLPWLLILGGSFLCFEGAEKVGEWFGLGHHETSGEEGVRDEKKLVLGAVRTDLILSAEIMLISLSNLDPGLSFPMTLGALVAIAFMMTIAVYGTVALLVKLDDIGLKMTENRATKAAGEGIVKAMPTVFKVISVIGTLAMLWVGGYLVMSSLSKVGFGLIYDFEHTLTAAVAGAGPVVQWFVATIFAGIFGLLFGLIIVGIVIGIARLLKRRPPLTEGGLQPERTPQKTSS